MLRLGPTRVTHRGAHLLCESPIYKNIAFQTITQQHEAKIIGLFESLSRPFYPSLSFFSEKKYIYIYIIQKFKTKEEKKKK